MIGNCQKTIDFIAVLFVGGGGGGALLTEQCLKKSVNK